MSSQLARWLLAAGAGAAVALGHAPRAQGQDATMTPSARAPSPASADEAAPLAGRARIAAPRNSGRKSRRRVKGEAVVTYPGFRLLPDGKSRVFVELTRAVAVEERRARGSLIYTLRGANVPVRNNRNPLITTHFATPVARARLVSTAADVDLVIELRGEIVPTHQVVPSEGGGARLEVDFPAGDYPPAPDRDTAQPGAGASAAPPTESSNDAPAVSNPAPASP